MHGETVKFVCDHSSPVCPHNFSFHALSLYFLCDMSYSSSHLRTNSINFSSISDDNQAGLIASKHSKRSGDDVITAHMIRIKHVGHVPSRQTFSLGDDDGTELRRDGDVPVSVNISVLITHEESLLNGDVPRRNGNVTSSVIRPLGYPEHLEPPQPLRDDLMTLTAEIIYGRETGNDLIGVRIHSICGNIYLS